MKPNQKDTVFHIEVDNKVTCKPIEIVTAFNGYFSQVAETLASCIPSSYCDPYPNLID